MDKKRKLNRIAGTIAILLILVIVVFLSWKIGAVESRIEGPHLFDEGSVLKKLTIEYRGQKIEQKSVAISQENWSKEGISVQFPDSGKETLVRQIEKPSIPPVNYDLPKEMLVLSDLEGDYDYLSKMLIGNGIINDKLEWTFNDGHLVIVGDVFDRGEYVTEILWLLYHLELESKKSGGRLHLILGNHEIMAMSGDHRYLNKKYKKLLSGGDLEYKDLFSNQTVLGKWLRTKNAVEVVGNILFVHGGLSPKVNRSKQSISEMNTHVRNALLQLDTDTSDAQQLIMGMEGPLWYRGYIEEKLEQSNIDSITANFSIKHIVVGHTIVPQITVMYNNSVVPIDIKRKPNKWEALWIENGTLFKIDEYANKVEL